jgi:hypothetical protein
MKPITVAVATRLLTSEKACGTIAIEITASTAPEDVPPVVEPLTAVPGVTVRR